VPALALRLPVKKLAAAVALAAGAGYLALSGGSVATERAFVMVAVVFAAVLTDRRALTLRAVALAALIVLALRPEALVGPGFQMSFAATTALVAVFGALHGRRLPGRLGGAAAGLVLSSAVAGLATAPIAAAHFNQLAHYGLIANVLSIPVMGMVVVPSAVLAALLAPFGADGIGFWLMGQGLGWILRVAHVVAGLGGAVSHVPAPPAVVLPMIALGALWVVLWRGAGRAVGLAPVAAAFLVWAMAERPALLISDDGGLVGAMTPAGRAISKPRGEGFVARSWLENDGDPALQAEAAGRAGWSRSRSAAEGTFGALKVAHLTGRHAAEAVPAACAAGGIVVTDARVHAPGCRLFDARRLRGLGAVAIYEGPGGGKIVSGRALAGRRPWNGG
jgi:competence protein ComEC